MSESNTLSVKRIFVISLIIFTFTLANAQISCDSFCIKNILIDTSGSPNKLRYAITLKGTNSNFINYPYISAITNFNSDTLGAGTMNLFGQFGGTAEVYDVNTSLDSIPTDFLIHFTFDTSICIFNNFCNPGPTAISTIDEEEINLFFNPSERIIYAKQAFYFNEAEIKILDVNGSIITKAFVHESFSEYALTDLKPGIYVFSLHWDNKKIFLKFLYL